MPFASKNGYFSLSRLVWTYADACGIAIDSHARTVELLAWGETEGFRLKLKGIRKMLCKVHPVVSARIEVKGIGNAAFLEELVKLLRAYVETEIVFRAAVEVDFQASGLRAIANDGKGAFAIPVCTVKRHAKGCSYQPRYRRLLLRIDLHGWRAFD